MKSRTIDGHGARCEPSTKQPRSSTSDVHHQLPLQIGGTSEPVRSPKLVVLPADYRLGDDVPEHRVQCPAPVNEYGVRRFGYPDEPKHRMCPHTNCRHNLWHVAGEDRPGRRWHAGEVNANQTYFSVIGPMARTRDSESSPNDVNMWTEDNCALDRIERQKLLDEDAARYEPMTHRQVAEACGDLTDRQVRRIVRQALRKLAELDEARELLEEMVER